MNMFMKTTVQHQKNSMKTINFTIKKPPYSTTISICNFFPNFSHLWTSTDVSSQEVGGPGQDRSRLHVDDMHAAGAALHGRHEARGSGELRSELCHVRWEEWESS